MCGDTREKLGFDKDHPFDTEIRDKFYEHQCDPFFTSVDHTGAGAAAETRKGADGEAAKNETGTDGMEGPPQFEMVEYTPAEYEAAEYPEGVEYKEVGHKDTVYEADEYSKAAYTPRSSFASQDYDEFAK